MPHTLLVIVLIGYIYTGKVTFEEIEPSSIFDLLVPSSKLGLIDIVEYIQSYLIDNKASWLRLKFNKVYSISFQDNNFKALQTFCTDILAKHPNLVFASYDFFSVQENALITLLKRDDLQIEESEIWDKIIEWGKAQTPNLPSDLEQWNDENFLALKTTLDKCIPLIRGSRDGFTRETFHRLCDNIPGTVVVIKINNTNEILGGYNPLVWNIQGKYFATTDSFIFSLKTKNLPYSIFSRIINADNAIGCSTSFGPIFGGGTFYMSDDYKLWRYYHNQNYEKRLRSDNFHHLIDEFEVFRVSL
ncbi:hypothetical protein C2G38_2146591 [Gigaspora rosea]|uniref:TLDc domain-containing protein n=1 Tax=Gigaspora rosea TaxID=44941 RepID=A0A397UGF3_9GLOM|nr:hypothetical protein C2G38_2146591 [Gigaspora rosea]